MRKSILIIGAGEGLSLATAEKFGQEGFTIGLINRDADKAKAMSDQLDKKGISVYTAQADATDEKALGAAIIALKAKLGTIDILLYNAAALKQKDILEVEAQEFLEDFQVNVAAALKSVQLSLPYLKESKGAILLTGGGLATHPSPKNGTLAIGKAGIRNLALQLNERLKADDIYVGTLTITAKVSPDSKIHNPIALARAYWEMIQERSQAEKVV